VDDFNKKVKAYFVRFCKDNSITAYKLAKRIGMAQQSVVRWFDFDTDAMPTLYAIRWLIENYNLDFEQLIDCKKQEGYENSTIVTLVNDINTGQDTMIGHRNSLLLESALELYNAGKIDEAGKLICEKLEEQLRDTNELKAVFNAVFSNNKRKSD